MTDQPTWPPAPPAADQPSSSSARSDIGDVAPRDPVADANDRDRAQFEAWKANQDAAAAERDAAVDGVPACPKCNTPDVNPSGEVLPHCWRCGYVATKDGERITGAGAWPPDDDRDRRVRNALARLGVPVA